MVTTRIEARYRHVGRSDDFYTYGETSILSVHKTMFGRVKIGLRRGYGDETYPVSRRTYKNWTAFNKEWEKV